MAAAPVITPINANPSGLGSIVAIAEPNIIEITAKTRIILAAI